MAKAAAQPAPPAEQVAAVRRGRRATARVKLIAAAYDVMSRNGLAGSSLAEIIETAGVGVGSFYNNFASKEDLAKAVFAERAEAFGTELEGVALRATNIAAATCYAYRRMIEEVVSDKVWASFIVQLEPSMQMLDGLLRDHARSGLGVGVGNGRLRIDDIETAITAVHALMIAFAKSVLDGGTTPAAAHHASLYVLRMFSVPEDEAVRLSRLPMAALRRELNQPPLTISPAP